MKTVHVSGLTEAFVKGEIRGDVDGHSGGFLESLDQFRGSHVCDDLPLPVLKIKEERKPTMQGRITA